MGEWLANNQDRAKAVWDKLLGFFGDALLRKFDAEPPAEWVEAIGKLNDFQVRRGFNRLLFGWKGGVPNLPDFVRLCRAIGDDAPDEGPSKLLALPSPDTVEYDDAAINANLRFLNYVTTRLSESARAWGIGSQQAEATRIAVAYKNAWAQDIREDCIVDAVTGEISFPPPSEQARTFAGCMERAEADIAVFLRGMAA